MNGPDGLRLLPQPRHVEILPGEAISNIPAPRERVDRSLEPQGYRLTLGDEVTLDFADEAGRRHGHTTLAQLARIAERSAGAPRAEAAAGVDVARVAVAGNDVARVAVAGNEPNVWPCRITDWPDIPVRAVMLDVSRDKVPALQTLEGLVDVLSAMKMNQLQLYMEHTFASAGHEEVWREADPYTAKDLEDLDSYCASRGVELVPNQNTLGHFERWLRHDRYRDLAIAPDGFEFFGMHRRPATLDPAKPGSLELVTDIVSQLAPVLGNRGFHVGLDEPWELPRERRGEWADWLKTLRSLAPLAERELYVWGDVPASDPALLGEIPDGVTVCDWGYEANHPFADRSGRLREAGLPFWVCPGTSSWLSITGRVQNMLSNVASATKEAVAYGAGGVLATDWGDMGHLQYQPSAEPGFCAAAAMSWCQSTNGDLDTDELAGLLDLFVFDDPAAALGTGLIELGKVHRMVTPQPFNMSGLVMHLLLPQWPVGSGPTKGLRVEELDEVAAALRSAQSTVRRGRPRRPDGDLVADELEASARMLRLACEDASARLGVDGRIESVDEPTRKRLANDVDEIISEHRRLWLARNRPGGLEDSVSWLENLRSAYLTGRTDPAWFGPLM